MAEHIICGKPGGGKSYFATTLLVKAIVETNTNIVTNLALKLPALNEYIQRKYPKGDYETCQRVRVLTDEETARFWDYRSTSSSRDGSTGCTYFIDEAHEHFNARKWASLHDSALHYLSQHRKLGDTIYAITQAPGNLDKQFRSVAEDYYHVRNEYTAKYFIFKGAGRFVVRASFKDPTQGNSDPFDKMVLRLDFKGLAECYDTAKGVGVLGSKADKGTRAKGIHIYWVIPMALGGASLVGIVPWLLGKAAQKVLMGKNTVQQVAQNPLNRPVLAPPLRQPVSSVSLPPQNATEVPKKLAYTGLVRTGNLIRLYLTDGTTLTDQDIASLFVDHVVLKNGQVIWPDNTPVKPPVAVTAASPLPVLNFPDASRTPPNDKGSLATAVPSGTAGGKTQRSAAQHSVPLVIGPPNPLVGAHP